MLQTVSCCRIHRTKRHFCCVLWPTSIR